MANRPRGKDEPYDIYKEALKLEKLKEKVDRSGLVTRPVEKNRLTRRSENGRRRN